MIVKVVPQKPIPGVLPKNKWISEEMELDLNKREILHCMQFGSVYIGDKLITNLNINLFYPAIIKVGKVPIAFEEVIQKPITETLHEESKVVPVQEIVKDEEPVDVSVEDTSEGEEEIVTISDDKIDYTLNTLFIEKENNHIILTTQFNTQYGKIGGNMYGLFNIIGGNRATLEYKVEDSWVKFNNKFANFDVIEDGQRFTFRLLPKNDNLIKFRIVIKDTQNQKELVKLEEEIDPSKL